MDRKFGLFCFVAALLFAPSSGAAAQDAAPAVLFSGVASNPQIRVGAAFANDRLALFFCGDAASVATQTKWLSFASALDDNWRYLPRDGWELYVHFHAGLDRLEGWVRPAASRRFFWFTAEVAPEGLGLYRAVNEYGVLGAIVTDLDKDGVLELQGALKVRNNFEQIVPAALVEPKAGELIVSTPVGAGLFTPVPVREISKVDF
jgi:hypothetical protein